MEGPPTVSSGPSKIALTYDENETAYVTAVTGYRNAYNGYDLDNIPDQRAWAANEPTLQNTLTQAWNKWNREGKKNVEEAQQLLVTTINDAVRYAIEQVQDSFKPERLMAPLVADQPRWSLSYAMPTNWYDAGCKGSGLSLKSSHLNKTATSEATQYSAGASVGWGLWSFGGSVSGGSKEDHAHMDAQSFELSAELILVRIMRPWLNTALFTMSGWNVTGYEKDGISKGTLEGDVGDLLLPLIPTAFVVAKNVVIDFGSDTQDTSHVEKMISTSAKVGWGPFSVSGSYSHSSSKDTFNSTFDGGKLRLPGMQLLGWLNTITPACPPENA